MLKINKIGNSELLKKISQTTTRVPAVSPESTYEEDIVENETIDELFELKRSIEKRNYEDVQINFDKLSSLVRQLLAKTQSVKPDFAEKMEYEPALYP